MTKEEFIKKIKEINATVPDEYFFLEYNKCVYDILKENEKLKKEVEIKHDGFMASIDDICEYAKENDKLRSVIDRAICCLKDMQFQYDGLGDLDVAIKILESGIKECQNFIE